MRPIKAAICAFVHHRGWCKGFHYANSSDSNVEFECPFKKAAMLALFPPIIIGKLENIDEMTDDIAKGLREPNTVIQIKD